MSPEIAEPTTLTVSQLNRQVRSLLESHFDYVWVEGEISNFAAPGSGHWYFSLKDGSAQVRCAMFRNRNQRLRFQPESGDAVRVRCRVSLYEGRGEFQLIVEHLEPAGAGALQVAFEKLKARLQAEGLFDASRKLPLPAAIYHLGVVTSASGAAVHDILTVLARRSPSIEVSLFPVTVQGEGAAEEIATAIENANRWHADGKINLDALIVGRGGGSLEDLWAFNEERVARAIAASELPIVSAVGHEVDFSIADLVADQRAATPSAAAEMLSRDSIELFQQFLNLEATLVAGIRRKLATASTELGHLRRRLQHPGARLREQSQRLDELEQRLARAIGYRLARQRSELGTLESRLRGRTPQFAIRLLQQRLTQQSQQLETVMQLRLRQSRHRLGQLSQLLDSLSPLAVLGRGYAILSNASGDIVSAEQQVSVGEKLRARLAHGQLQLEVTEKIPAAE